MKTTFSEFKFKEVKEINGHTDFRELENDYDSSIFYADGQPDDVIEAVKEEFVDGDWAKYIELFVIDGWFVAMWKN